MDTEPKYYTTKELAKIIKMSQGGIVHAIRDGKIPAMRFAGTKKWLIPKEYVEKLKIQSQTQTEKEIS